jgi:hypothetical protein
VGIDVGLGEECEERMSDGTDLATWGGGRTLDQALARINAILTRMEALARDVEATDRLMKSKLTRLEVLTLH